jgi:hypothetical protein
MRRKHPKVYHQYEEDTLVMTKTRPTITITAYVADQTENIGGFEVGRTYEFRYEGRTSAGARIDKVGTGVLLGARSFANGFSGKFLFVDDEGNPRMFDDVTIVKRITNKELGTYEYVLMSLRGNYANPTPADIRDLFKLLVTTDDVVRVVDRAAVEAVIAA